jgi:hypothetical protein
MSSQQTIVDTEENAGINRRNTLRLFAKNGLMLALMSLIIFEATAAGGKGSGRTLRLYRSNGRYAGRIESNGRHYDAKGRYAGRVEGQRIYDAQGRFIGRFEESGKFHENDNSFFNAEPNRNNLGSILESDGISHNTFSAENHLKKPRQDLIQVIPDSDNSK